MEIFANSKRIPSLIEDYFISPKGELKDLEYNSISLSDFNEKTKLDIDDVLILVCVTFQQFRWPPIYWSKLKVLRSVKNVTTPESLVLGLKEPVESKEYPGYYLIPYFSGYVISRCGKLIKRHNSEFMQASKGVGYYTYRMTCDSDTTSNRGRHRILCYAFKDYPYNVEDLDVNHLDGVRGHDDLDNLEWSTRRDNILHALRTGLRFDNKPIEARDIDTGQILIFYSCSQAGRHFKVTETTISNRAKTNGQVAYDGFQFRFLNDQSSWPKIEEELSGNFKVELPDGTVIFCNGRRAAKLADVTPTSLRRLLREGRNYGRNENRISKVTD